jgi:hypothetical protein
VVRSSGARLAVLLVVVSAAAPPGRTLGRATDSGCVTTPTGIDCGYSGGSTSTTVVTSPPLRYLAIIEDPAIGSCWFWSPYPPGYDSWDSAYDAAIINTRFLLPECPGRPGTVTTSVTEVAWQIFRSFPLEAPKIALRPEVGITNLPTLLELPRPEPLRHTETLPDGRALQVRAQVVTVWVDWGDGTPEAGYPADSAFGGDARHAYIVKTCPADYRVENPSGWRCHPTLDAYTVQVTYAWVGRFATDGSWYDLGSIDRTSTSLHDVDEVVGVLVAP